MTTGSGASDSNILESLPPIVPSIGLFPRSIRPGSSVNAATDGNPSDDPSRTTAAPPDAVRVGNRLILTSTPARSWAWRGFTSSARHDSAEFHHWVRANVEYADYPYARFDVSLNPLVYTDEEYARYFETTDVSELMGGEWDLVAGELKRRRDGGEEDAGRTKAKHAAGDSAAVDDNNSFKNSKVTDKPSSSSSSSSSTSTLQRLLTIHNKVLPWTKSETDALLELARSCDLRWPVIVDRWRSRFDNSPASNLRGVEDLQHRYYEVGSVLIQRRAEAIVAREVAKLSGGGEGALPAVGPAVVGEGPGGGGDAATIASGGAGSASTAEQGSSTAESAAAPASSTVKAESKLPAPSAAAAAARQQSESDPVFPPAEIEALQQLHHQISLDPALAPPLAVPETGTAHHRGGRVFDLAAERARRAQLDRLWHRTKEEEREEEELRAELRAVEVQLRKLKRAGKHAAPAGSASAAPAAGGAGGDGGPGTPGGGSRADGRWGTSAAVVAAAGASNQTSSSAALPPPHRPMPPLSLAHHRPPFDLYMHTHQSVSASFVDTAPVPTPGTPYLQSGRLFPPAIEGHSGLNQNTLKQMNAILQELNVPKEPVPTKRNCDLYDGVRKDALTLLILQKILLRKEGELNAKREKMLEIQRAAAAAKEEAEKKKNSDERVEDSNDGKGEGGKDGKVVPKVKAKRQRADSAASNQDDTAAAERGGGGTGKKGSDGPKKKYQKKPKADPNSAATAVIAAATLLPSATNAASIPAAGQPTGAMPPLPAIPSAVNPAVSPMVTSTKQTAAAKPPPSINSHSQPQLGNGNDASADLNNTSAPVSNPAKVPGKRGRKPKKKQP